MKYILALILPVVMTFSLFAAVGCDLNDPDRDVKRLFPNSTGYRTFYRSIDNIGGEELLSIIEERLGDEFSGLYETIDVPYTVYEIYDSEEIIGYIHGVNQRGRFGGMQVFLALTPDLTITDFYIQRLSSRHSRLYRSDDFAGQFIGLDAKDFDQLDILTGEGEGKAAGITSPAPADDPDFLAIMRGVKKNLIMMEYFIE